MNDAGFFDSMISLSMIATWPSARLRAAITDSGKGEKIVTFVVWADGE